MGKLKLYFISDPKVCEDPGGALAAEMEIVEDHILVTSMNDLIQRAIRTAVQNQTQIDVMVIASHGNSFTFDIGENTLGPLDKRLHALSVLRPFFARGAHLIINACEFGNNTDTMKMIAKILGVKVIAYTGDIDVKNVLTQKVVVPRGLTVVCNGDSCTETDAWEEAKKKMMSGPDNVPAFAREY